MHAVVMTLTIDPAKAPAAAAALMDDILPRLRSAPGFISGYWLEPVEGSGFAFLLFESEEQASAATPPVSDWSAPGITVNGVEIRRVAAAAP